MSWGRIESAVIRHKMEARGVPPYMGPYLTSFLHLDLGRTYVLKSSAGLSTKCRSTPQESASYPQTWPRKHKKTNSHIGIGLFAVAHKKGLAGVGGILPHDLFPTK